MYGSLYLRELLTEMTHGDNLTDGKRKDPGRYNNSWSHTRDTENTKNIISFFFFLLYTQTLHFPWQISPTHQFLNKLYSGIYVIFIFFHNYPSLWNTLDFTMVWLFQVQLTNALCCDSKAETTSVLFTSGSPSIGMVLGYYRYLTGNDEFMLLASVTDLSI